MKSTVIAVLAAVVVANAGEVVTGSGVSMPGMDVNAAVSYNEGSEKSSSWSPPSSKPTPSSSLSVVYTTSVHTIYSCSSTVTNCPYTSAPSVVTSTIPAYTTYCPVSETGSSSGSVSTAYTTEVLTISQCHPSETGKCSLTETPTTFTYTHPATSTANLGEVTSLPGEQKPGNSAPAGAPYPSAGGPPPIGGKPGYASSSAGIITSTKSYATGAVAPTQANSVVTGAAQPSSGSVSSGKNSTGQYLETTGAATSVQAGSFAAFAVMAAAAMML